MAQKNGCKDINAVNYNSTATISDGSCIYPDLVLSPITSIALNEKLNETSGLTPWNGSIWTHNDSGTDTNIYALDTLGNILNSYLLKGTVNTDWEDMSQDEDYIYVGDFGNNACGCRQNLNILRISKKSIANNAPLVDSIQFSYANQTNFTPTIKHENTNFDCEAFIVTPDSIYLFTKEWISNKTSLYSLSKKPGKHKTNYKATLDVKGLITGACYLPTQNKIILCGYSQFLQPFIYLLSDFTSPNFFGGNKRRMNLSLPFHQVEAVTSINGKSVYISNEAFKKSSYINTPQKLHILELP